jgi:hypothetical protein
VALGKWRHRVALHLRVTVLESDPLHRHGRRIPGGVNLEGRRNEQRARADVAVDMHERSPLLGDLYRQVVDVLRDRQVGLDHDF